MKILLATDGSKFANDAAAFLARLPHREEMDLTVMSVVPTLAIFNNSEVKEWQRKYSEAQTKQANQNCLEIERFFEGADVNVEKIVTSGHPGSEIVSEARKRKCDFIVIGAMGHSLLERMMVGSVSDYVATHASCSVLVVRPTGLGSKNHGRLNVCIAYDTSVQSRYAMIELESFQWGAETHFDIVSGFGYPFDYVDVPIAIEMKEIECKFQQNLDAVAMEAQKVLPNVQPHLLQTLHVGEALVEFTSEKKSDLIVLGDTGYGLLERTVLGSVSRYVLRHASCSVWIARKPRH